MNDRVGQCLVQSNREFAGTRLMAGAGHFGLLAQVVHDRLDPMGPAGDGNVCLLSQHGHGEVGELRILRHGTSARQTFRDGKYSTEKEWPVSLSLMWGKLPACPKSGAS